VKGGASVEENACLANDREKSAYLDLPVENRDRIGGICTAAVGTCRSLMSVTEEGETMRQHTTLNLDLDLLREAQRELGTREKTETIHRALQEAINLRRRQRLAERTLPGLTPESLEQIRRNRPA
jgi:Arc/MetJ family transcription regulator